MLGCVADLEDYKLDISTEDKLCLGTNKWLIAHKDAPEAENGAFVGLIGENITIK